MKNNSQTDKNKTLYYNLLKKVTTLIDLMSDENLQNDKLDLLIILDKEIKATLVDKAFIITKFFKDILFIIEFLAISSLYYYIGLYFYSLRHFINDITTIYPLLQFNKVNNILEIYSLEEIAVFYLLLYLKVSNDQRLKTRKFSESILKNNELKDYLSCVVNNSLIYDFLTFPLHELLLQTFPKYLFLFNATWKEVFFNDETLPLTHRFFIGIISASISKSYYTFRLLDFLFISNVGDEKWLIEGLKATPIKIQMISGLLNKLANNCWSITKDDINYLKSSQQFTLLLYFALYKR